MLEGGQVLDALAKQTYMLGEVLWGSRTCHGELKDKISTVTKALIKSHLLWDLVLLLLVSLLNSRQHFVSFNLGKQGKGKEEKHVPL